MANNLAAANYDFAYVNGTPTVNKAVLTATADAQTRLYGQSNPTFTETVSGYQSTGDTASVLTGSATGSAAATMTTGVGTAIRCLGMARSVDFGRMGLSLLTMPASDTVAGSVACNRLALTRRILDVDRPSAATFRGAVHLWCRPRCSLRLQAPLSARPARQRSPGASCGAAPESPALSWSRNAASWSIYSACGNGCPSRAS